MLETRISVKILTLVLIKGFSSAQGGRLHPMEYVEFTTAKQRGEKYISTIQHIINKTVIGTSVDCL